ncbi:hypothetical protein BU23DRAFT_559411 [Bimuria novae-zelandiae CBS 107.79]|uniref:Uncharacterized protein n=1 Tax=Bimuria novae-zelandiae CBS 107.79 TaxID=1447943 RepID=A0A6A5UWU1_9PLEO|nr:hypothetical protein BU23DRAFT_559411 [Bimuria novae-zelandiae CBS 107.79]
MLPTARLTATFVPLLSRPLRVSLQSLRCVTRRPRLVPSPPCRALHLYKSARSRTVLGMHKLIPFSRYDPPDPAMSDHKINIVKLLKANKDGPDREMVAEGVSLKEVYDNYIEPGNMLRLANSIHKRHTSANVDELEKFETAQKYKDYTFLKAHSTPARVKVEGRTPSKAITKAKISGGEEAGKEIRHLQMLREVHLLLATPREHFSQMMDKAYQFIELSCPVEFSIRVKNVTEKKWSKTQSKSTHLFDYAFQRFPHLRPDFILKAMPPGTVYMIEPFSDGRHVQFVLGLKPAEGTPLANMNLTRRALNVKAAAENAIKQGKANELPSVLRFQRIQAGDENYSLDSSVARAALDAKDDLVVAKTGKRSGHVVKWGVDSLEGSVNGTRMAEWKKNWTRSREGADNDTEMAGRQESWTRANYRGDDTAGAEASAQRRHENKVLMTSVNQGVRIKEEKQMSKEQKERQQRQPRNVQDPGQVDYNRQVQKRMVAKREEYKERQRRSARERLKMERREVGR